MPRYRLTGRLRTGRKVKTGKARKQELKTDRRKGKNAGRLDETKQTGNRQTENTGISSLGIMGKMGDTWRGGRQAQRQLKQIRV